MAAKNMEPHVSVNIERASSFSIHHPFESQSPEFQERRNSVPNGTLLSTGSNSPVQRVRSFSMTPKGLKNCGDQLRRRSTLGNETGSTYHSNGSLQETDSQTSSIDSLASEDTFRVAILGADGVGMRTLKNQFTTSEELCINNQEENENENENEIVCVSLDGEESFLAFVDQPEFMNIKKCEPVDTILVVFSVANHQSFKGALRKLQFIRQELGFDRTVFLVANKVDLVRSRVISEKDARKVADKFRCKYIETSVALNHNVDELLVGIVRQARYQREESLIPTPTEKTAKSKSKVSRITNILIDRIRNIGNKEAPCTNLFDV